MSRRWPGAASPASAPSATSSRWTQRRGCSAGSLDLLFPHRCGNGAQTLKHPPPKGKRMTDERDAPDSGGMRIEAELVRQLAELLNQNELTEIEVEDGEPRIVVKREVHVAAAAPVAAAPPPPPPAAAPAAFAAA